MQWRFRRAVVLFEKEPAPSHLRLGCGFIEKRDRFFGDEGEDEHDERDRQPGIQVNESLDDPLLDMFRGSLARERRAFDSNR